MAEENKERWLNYLSFTTVLIAVCATLSTFKGGGYSTKSLLSQNKASDQWAFYQSKSLKSYLYEIQEENLESELARVGDKPDVTGLKERISSYKKKVDKYAKEKEDISNKAKAFEATRDECKLHSDAFGLAVIFLQISILLSSISALVKKKPIWYCSIALGIAGVFYFLNGFWLFL
jgi:hypothetical protein